MMIDYRKDAWETTINVLQLIRECHKVAGPRETLKKVVFLYTNKNNKKIMVFKLDFDQNPKR